VTDYILKGNKLARVGLRLIPARRDKGSSPRAKSSTDSTKLRASLVCSGQAGKFDWGHLYIPRSWQEAMRRAYSKDARFIECFSDISLLQ